MLSSSFGIKFAEFSHSFVKSSIFDESYKGNKVRKMCVFNWNRSLFYRTFSSLSSSFFIFCFMCFRSSRYLTSCLSNSLNSSLQVLRSLSSSWIQDKVGQHNRYNRYKFRMALLNAVMIRGGQNHSYKTQPTQGLGHKSGGWHPTLYFSFWIKKPKTTSFW